MCNVNAEKQLLGDGKLVGIFLMLCNDLVEKFNISNKKCPFIHLSRIETIGHLLVYYTTLFTK